VQSRIQTAGHPLGQRGPSHFGLGQDLRQNTPPLGPEVFKELIATIEGAKGLIRPKERNLASQDERTKGKQAELVEAAITLFDQAQKWGRMGTVTGPQRVRGLAGSGKTVVLAMKAAQLHLQHREAHTGRAEGTGLLPTGPRFSRCPY
jgi:hypothetical protein